MTAAHTPGPWGWVIEDHSMASLGVLPDPGLGNPLVMTLGPCPACAGRAKGEWKWGRCQTPSEADANLIAAAPELLAALDAVDLARHTDAPADWQRATDLSDAAFAKARGGTAKALPVTSREMDR